MLGLYKVRCYIYIYIYIYMFVRRHGSVRVLVINIIYIYIYIYMFVRRRGDVHVCVHACVHTCIYLDATQRCCESLCYGTPIPGIIDGPVEPLILS